MFSTKWLRRSILIMRVVCPLNVASCLAAGVFATIIGRHVYAAIDFFCAGACSVLTFINWFFLTPPKGN